MSASFGCITVWQNVYIGTAPSSDQGLHCLPFCQHPCRRPLVALQYGKTSTPGLLLHLIRVYTVCHSISIHVSVLWLHYSMAKRLHRDCSFIWSGSTLFAILSASMSASFGCITLWQNIYIGTTPSSDQGLHCLPFYQHPCRRPLVALQCGKTSTSGLLLHLIRIYTVCHSISIHVGVLWLHYSMAKRLHRDCSFIWSGSTLFAILSASMSASFGCITVYGKTSTSRLLLHLIRVYTVCHSISIHVSILWLHYSMAKRLHRDCSFIWSGSTLFAILSASMSASFGCITVYGKTTVFSLI